MPDIDAISEDLRKDLEIDDTNLDGELLKHPSKYFYWGHIFARANRRARKEKLKLKELEAMLAKNFRDNMATEAPGTRVTEKMVTEFMYGHPDYLAQEKAVIDGEYVAEMLEVGKFAMYFRQQSLIELRKMSAEDRQYGDEIKAMRAEFDERVKKERGEDIPH